MSRLTAPGRASALASSSMPKQRYAMPGRGVDCFLAVGEAPMRNLSSVYPEVYASVYLGPGWPDEPVPSMLYQLMPTQRGGPSGSRERRGVIDDGRAVRCRKFLPKTWAISDR